MSDTVKCPMCGAVQRDLWDCDWGSREELTVPCGSCGKDYILHRTVSVSYEAFNVHGDPAKGGPMSSEACGICDADVTNEETHYLCASCWTNVRDTKEALQWSREHAEALDKNWSYMHEAAMGAIREALGMSSDATVQEMVAVIQRMRARLQS
jgi:hypothetical protein